MPLLAMKERKKGERKEGGMKGSKEERDDRGRKDP